MTAPVHYVVYDLEYTAWPGSWERGWSAPGEHREIVQIGAVRVDAAFGELDSLCLLVRPRINPGLSEYFTALTGIAQADIDRLGLDFPEALAMLRAFAEPDLTLVSNGVDAEIIQENCRLCGIDSPFAGRTLDVHGELLAASGRARLVSADLPELFGLGDCGRCHDALADARAVAGALRTIRNRDAG
jgi:inhibitor of KinA sporulation pathway (predicted exonuclease)